MSREIVVTHLRRLSLDDGPGWRTTVFLKGCPLACVWCHNPENIRTRPQPIFSAERCLACGDCIRACGASALGEKAPPAIAVEACTGCGDCASACDTTALRVAGGRYAPGALARALLEDRIFHETSGGGVTFSGGEPTMQLDGVAEVAALLKRERVHLAVQTAGTFRWDAFRDALLPHLDLVFFDLKLLDPDLHRRYTGSDNAVILDNFARLCADGRVQVIPRVPLVPGVTATTDNLVAIARFVRRCGGRAIELLPYNPAGITKRRALGMPAVAALPEASMSPSDERRVHSELSEAWRGAIAPVA